MTATTSSQSSSRRLTQPSLPASRLWQCNCGRRPLKRSYHAGLSIHRTLIGPSSSGLKHRRLPASRLLSAILLVYFSLFTVKRASICFPFSRVSQTSIPPTASSVEYPLNSFVIWFGLGGSHLIAFEAGQALDILRLGSIFSFFYFPWVEHKEVYAAMHHHHHQSWRRTRTVFSGYPTHFLSAPAYNDFLPGQFHPSQANSPTTRHDSRRLAHSLNTLTSPDVLALSLNSS